METQVEVAVPAWHHAMVHAPFPLACSRARMDAAVVEVVFLLSQVLVQA